METKTCRKCGACWVAGQLYWATGAKAKEEDLAGLVCNSLGGDHCINPKKGDISGDSWDKRAEYSEAMDEEFNVDTKD